ncbi:MAG: RnfH family protein [Rubrivivax sp.]|jgi:putative ubiquitin-RnfH superfamily antitoxin RatB of RatAB toxin-antitoxin module
MIRVDVVCSPRAREVVMVPVDLPEGATLHEALRTAAADPRAACLSAGDWDVGIWGRRQPGSTVLKDADRVEAWRCLRCDPKEARRQRYRQSPVAARRLKRAP